MASVSLTSIVKRFGPVEVINDMLPTAGIKLRALKAARNGRARRSLHAVRSGTGGLSVRPARS